MRRRRQGLLQPLYYFPFPFLQCQFLIPSLWGAQDYPILSSRCSLCRLTFGPIFQIGDGCFLPRTKASSFSHFVLIWPRKQICLAACLGTMNAGLHRGQYCFLCRSWASYPQVHTGSVPIWYVGSPEYSKLGMDAFRGQRPFNVVIPLGLIPWNPSLTCLSPDG